MPPKRLNLKTISEKRLLEARFCDLPIRYEGSWVEVLVKKVYRELKAKNILHEPHVWLSTEWFSPDHHPGIAVPFYMVHPRLKALEKK